MLLFKNRKLITTLFSLAFLLISHLASWASKESTELEIINNTKDYNIQAKDIELYFQGDLRGTSNSQILNPNKSQTMKWPLNVWLSYQNLVRMADIWHSSLNLYVTKTEGQEVASKKIPLQLKAGETKISEIPITIKIARSKCYTSAKYFGNVTYSYCDYKLTVIDTPKIK